MYGAVVQRPPKQITRAGKALSGAAIRYVYGCASAWGDKDTVCLFCPGWARSPRRLANRSTSEPSRGCRQQTNPTIQPSVAIRGLGPKESSAQPGPVALTPSLTADFKFGSPHRREDTSSFFFVLLQPRGTNSQLSASFSASCLTVPRPVQPPNGGGR